MTNNQHGILQSVLLHAGELVELLELIEMNRKTISIKTLTKLMNPNPNHNRVNTPNKYLFK